MTNINKHMEEASFYEEKFGETPSNQKIKRKKPKPEDGSKRDNDKRNKFDKKNAQKAPWKGEY